MSLFVLEAKDMARRPTLASFDWRNGVKNYYTFYRNWQAILRIPRANLWFALFINACIVLALDASVVALLLNTDTVDQPVLLFFGLVVLLTVLYVPNIIKLANFLMGRGYHE